ncbi:helix-turn-helix transcriptional regulator [Saccharopolyspora sp. NPDC000359]|uniref:helix-turn-helix domain-containing protein n=1 Tax=Saccharopolyspora sp. NPDC000359 TaxID=3154251 RepID=UPI003318AFE3
MSESSFGHELRRLREQAGLSQRALARRASLDQANISRYERGLQTPPSSTAAVLDDELGAGGQLRLLATGSAAHLVLDHDEQTRVAEAVQDPRRLDSGAVRAMALVLAAQRRLDDVLGPEPLLPAVDAQMHLAMRMARQARAPHQAAMAEVAAEWVQFAGWLRAEAADYGPALKVLAAADRAAVEIGSGVLAAQVHNFRGYIGRQRGDWRQVTSWFIREHYTPGASVHQRIGAAAQAAQGHVRLGDRDAGLRLVERAEQLLDQAAGEPAPRTAYWLTRTFHALNLGLTHLALGDAAAAVDHLTTGLDGLPVAQRSARWTHEYRAALARARAQQ